MGSHANDRKEYYADANMGTNIEMTFGMIKPEGLERKLEQDISSRIERSGLIIIERKIHTLKENELYEIYGHVEGKIPEIYKLMKTYLTTNDVMLLKIKGEYAISKVLSLRGASNPAEAKPGTIRGDYAKDQDYAMTLKEKRICYNIFHCADNAKEAKLCVELFFGSPGGAP